MSDRSVSECSGSSRASQEKRNDRKRPKKVELLEKSMDGIMSKISKLQEESDARFYNMEMKRMEKEERRWREDSEREERQRREERDFQLKVFQILAGQLAFHVPQITDYYSDGRSLSYQQYQY